MLSQRVEMITCLQQLFLGLDLSHFVLLKPGSTHFIQSFLVMGPNGEKRAYVLVCTQYLQAKNLIKDKNE